MATPAQILANRQNAEKSHGPVTVEGKARVSQNATQAHRQPLGLPLCAAPKEPGLFSVANFVRPEEQDIFNDFESSYLAELVPATSLEQTLAREIIHAAWRLRRCASLEVAPPEDLIGEELDRLQLSIDRARAAAQRTFHRSLKELRRLQTEHLHPAEVMIRQAMAADAFAMKELEKRRQQGAETAARNSAKQSQTETDPPSAKPRLIPRSAPCPCKSGLKYKRCCGKNAAPVLSNAAA